MHCELPNAGTIADAASVPLTGTFPITSARYTIDKTPPSVSFVLPDPTTNAAATVHFTVNFSENVTGVNQADFALQTTGGITGASITGVSGSGNSYTVTVNTGTGEGTLALQVPTAGTIVDLAGNPMLGPFPLTSSAYTIDKPPSVTSIAIADPSPTNAATVHYTVTFSKSVTGVDEATFSNFTLIHTGTIAGASISSITGTGSTYTVTVNTGSGDGTLGLELADAGTIKTRKTWG